MHLWMPDFFLGIFLKCIYECMNIFIFIFQLWPWQCRESFTLNFGENEVETMTVWRGFQNKWIHECMQYFSFLLTLIFFCERWTYALNPMKAWECIYIFLHPHFFNEWWYENFYENACIKFYFSFFIFNSF